MSLDEVRAYDAELVGRLADVVGGDLVGVYVSGSVALGDYVPGRSDLDRLVVVSRPLRPAVKGRVVAAARHEALPCPARGLELVVYTREAAARATGEAELELNLNTGRAMPFHVTFDAAEEPAHWFVLDRAIVREHGSALVGPPPADVFAPVPRETALHALADSIRWHAGNPVVAGESVVLNALRAWHFAATDGWASKAEAAVWARGRGADPGLVDAALAARMHGRAAPLDPDAAGRLTSDVLALVERAAAQSPAGVRDEQP